MLQELSERSETAVSLYNLTQHHIRLYRPDGTTLELLPSGKVARVASAPEILGEIEGVPVLYTTYEQALNLPDPQEGVIYITSWLVAEVTKRADVVCPDTSPRSAVRDEHGKLLGVKSLRSYTNMGNFQPLRMALFHEPKSVCVQCY
ncbi:MAG: hypothetical protein LLF90_00725 [Methanomicrobiaceae archaeon]|uniref:hypothetical protein n=1 Tax=Methanoculleus sp. TaxID=90427 RepID=UPI00320FE523|nr:hypothetical protein [Methanomicrobiaceae archaeon]